MVEVRRKNGQRVGLIPFRGGIVTARVGRLVWRQISLPSLQIPLNRLIYLGRGNHAEVRKVLHHLRRGDPAEARIQLDAQERGHPRE